MRFTEFVNIRFDVPGNGKASAGHGIALHSLEGAKKGA